MATKGNNPKVTRARDREAKALELRKAGASFPAIGQALGISDEGARKAVSRALARVAQQTDESATEYRALELERLDHMQMKIARQVNDGHLGAIDRALRIMERRAKLLGLDAPVRQDVQATIGYIVDLGDAGSDSAT